jgi:hypothetical protein
MKRTLGLIALLGMSVILSACGGGGSSNKSPAKPIAVITTEAAANTTFSLKDGAVTVQLNAANSSSPRDAALTYRWELIARPTLSTADLNETENTDTKFTADIPGEYVASLIVNDGTLSSDAARITFIATSPVPVAITETTYNVSLGIDSLGLDARTSQPPTGETGELDYQWSILEKPINSTGYMTNSERSQATLFLDIIGAYKLQLVVSYAGVNSQPAIIIVTVSEGDLAPMAKAEDMTIEVGQEVILDGSASHDPEGKALQYRWKWTSSPVKPSGVPVPKLTGATTATARFTPTAAASYNLTFFVFDGTRKSEEKDVIVTVIKDPSATSNTAPIGEVIATGYYPSYSIGEQEVGLRAEFNFAGYDPEGDALQVINATLIEKPAGSTAELVKIGSWKPLGKKIKKLDVAGTYRVQMTISDGTNEIIKEATMEAKVGNVNGQPSTRGVDAQSKSVLIGNALVFDASSKDPNNDPMTFHWELTDKPDGSKAVIEAVIEPESQEYRRAKVVTDVPGSYTARLIVSDDRGLYAKSYSEDDGIAKLTNTPPEIRSVVWARSWGRLAPGENYYQILPCMSLLHRPVLVDVDSDEVHYHEELISAPEGGEFTSYPSDEDCPDSRGQVFSKPGNYTFRYYATDLIDDAPNYDFVVTVDPIEEAKGLRLRSLNSSNESLWQPLPHIIVPTYGYVTAPTSRPIVDESSINWSLSAVDANYTIENVNVTHINGGLTDLTPHFEGLSEGLTIEQGKDLNFKTIFPAVPCLRTDDKYEGFHLSFNIKEIPEISFVYETWVGASDFMSKWTECQPGELN